MRNIILIFSLIAMAVFGYFVMDKFDRFLAKNRKVIAKQKSKIRNPYIVFNGDAKEETIKNEIKKFRQDHSCTYVVICDPTEFDSIDFEELCNAEQTEKR